MASNGERSSCWRKRGSSPASALAPTSASPKTSWLTAPANAVGTPSPAMTRATFQVEPPTWLVQPCRPVAQQIGQRLAGGDKGGSRSWLGSKHVQYFIAGAHGVVIGLACRAFSSLSFRWPDRARGTMRRAGGRRSGASCTPRSGRTRPSNRGPGAHGPARPPQPGFRPAPRSICRRRRSRHPARSRSRMPPCSRPTALAATARLNSSAARGASQSVAPSSATG
jgi:hypothetical protein